MPQRHVHRVERLAGHPAQAGIAHHADHLVRHRLAEIDDDKCSVVELKFFGGLTTDEIAEVTGRSTRSIERDWLFARSWLYTELVNV